MVFDSPGRSRTSYTGPVGGVRRRYTSHPDNYHGGRLLLRSSACSDAIAMPPARKAECDDLTATTGPSFSTCCWHPFNPHCPCRPPSMLGRVIIQRWFAHLCTAETQSHHKGASAQSPLPTMSLLLYPLAPSWLPAHGYEGSRWSDGWPLRQQVRECVRRLTGAAPTCVPHSCSSLANGRLRAMVHPCGYCTSCVKEATWSSIGPSSCRSE